MRVRTASRGQNTGNFSVDLHSVGPKKVRVSSLVAKFQQPARRQNQRIEQTIPLDKLHWITVRQASIRYPFMTEKAWRHKIAQAATAPRFE